MSMILLEGSQSKRIDVVFDTYRENSIKNIERSIRGESPGEQVMNITRLANNQAVEVFL